MRCAVAPNDRLQRMKMDNREVQKISKLPRKTVALGPLLADFDLWGSC
jgi:hypothetical protein